MNNQKKWEILGKIQNPKSKLQIEKIVKVLLENRGIKTKKDKEEFFNPPNPENISLEILGIKRLEVEKAIERLKKAKKNNEKVIVYGDYDADGICATAVLWETLYEMGFDVLPYIPERFSEGYGLNAESIENIKIQNSNVKLIITVDNGIVANMAVDIANEQGIDVIITDHHLMGRKLPKAHSMIHTTKIGGAAIAWKLAKEIEKKVKGQRSKVKSSNGLELAAIGTIADQMPLTGFNRSFAKYGLAELNHSVRLGLEELFRQAGIKKGSIGTYEVNFLIAPRLNAMGRMEHAIESLRLLCTGNREKAERLARRLNEVNQDRQRVVEEVVLHAKGFVANDQRVIVIAHESYHEGVIGLAASKLVEEFHRPAIVISKKAGVAKASARSIPGFNIIETIRKMESLIIGGGGHSMAAGFSIETKKIKAFSQKLSEISNPLLTDEILSKRLKIDLVLDFAQLDFDLYGKLTDFEPTGIGNPKPIFATEEVEVVGARVVGRESNHLKLRLKKAGIAIDAIGFGLGEFLPTLTPEKKIDVAYNLEENIWNGNKNLQLKLKDLKISSG